MEKDKFNFFPKTKNHPPPYEVNNLASKLIIHQIKKVWLNYKLGGADERFYHTAGTGRGGKLKNK